MDREELENAIHELSEAYVTLIGYAHRFHK